MITDQKQKQAMNAVDTSKDDNEGLQTYLHDAVDEALSYSSTWAHSPCFGPYFQQ
jgi:hypothetical protein